MSNWVTFFSAEVGASAALSGLVFVALSINLRQIVATPTLVGRAAEALVLLVEPVVLGLFVLTPLSRSGQGWSSFALSVMTWVVLASLVWRARTAATQRPWSEFATRAISVGVAASVEVVGSLALALGHSFGLNWLGFGGVVCVAAGIADAWVLLVEILR